MARFGSVGLWFGIRSGGAGPDRVGRVRAARVGWAGLSWTGLAFTGFGQVGARHVGPAEAFRVASAGLGAWAPTCASVQFRPGCHLGILSRPADCAQRGPDVRAIKRAPCGSASRGRKWGIEFAREGGRECSWRAARHGHHAPARGCVPRHHARRLRPPRKSIGGGPPSIDPGALARAPSEGSAGADLGRQEPRRGATPCNVLDNTHRTRYLVSTLHDIAYRGGVATGA